MSPLDIVDGCKRISSYSAGHISHMSSLMEVSNQRFELPASNKN